MTLKELIEEIRGGNRPDYEDLRLAVIILDRLLSVELSHLLMSEDLTLYKKLIERHEAVTTTRMKGLIAWEDHPDNPEFQEKKQLVDAIIKGRLH